MIVRLIFILGIICSKAVIAFCSEVTNLDSIILNASTGDAYYQGVLGAIYRRGEVGEINYRKAYEWYCNKEMS
ncbi:hypothetical protein K9N50_07695 [bacterium]|nr:hypothetical protein [bacterium]